MNIYGLGHKNIGGFVLQCTRYVIGVTGKKASACENLI